MTTINNLYLEDKFQFEGNSKRYIYLGIYSYGRTDYFIYKSNQDNKPYILKYKEVKFEEIIII